MQYGKGITTGLILEPTHRQGELERKGRAETNSVTKSHIKVRARPLTPILLCVLSHSHISLILDKVVEKLEMAAHTHKHTLS